MNHRLFVFEKMAYFEPLYGYIPVSVTKKKNLKLSQTEKKKKKPMAIGSMFCFSVLPLLYLFIVKVDI